VNANALLARSGLLPDADDKRVVDACRIREVFESYEKRFNEGAAAVSA
jgi:hypothetical protein